MNTLSTNFNRFWIAVTSALSPSGGVDVVVVSRGINGPAEGGIIRGINGETI
ncbi:unnamed protein product [marine sediment metagenome]|uniref:Uncharacterized protein n=1 Tax=marine sediment metagenome TaxID=412755 RepID=X1BUF5_9ZZZZ